MKKINQQDIRKGDKVLRTFPNGVYGMEIAAQTFIAGFDGYQGLAGDEAAVYYLIDES